MISSMFLFLFLFAIACLLVIVFATSLVPEPKQKETVQEQKMDHIQPSLPTLPSSMPYRIKVMPATPEEDRYLVVVKREPNGSFNIQIK